MPELYCPRCQGTVNAGGLCPYQDQPNDCPLTITEAEHKADLEDEA